MADKLRVMVYRRDIPVNIPWKKVVVRFIFCCRVEKSSFISVSNEFVVNTGSFDFYFDVSIMYYSDICVN